MLKLAVCFLMWMVIIILDMFGSIITLLLMVAIMLLVELISKIDGICQLQDS